MTYEEVNMSKHSLNKDDNDMVELQLLIIVNRFCSLQVFVRREKFAPAFFSKSQSTHCVWPVQCQSITLGGGIHSKYYRVKSIRLGGNTHGNADNGKQHHPANITPLMFALTHLTKQEED